MPLEVVTDDAPPSTDRLAALGRLIAEAAERDEVDRYDVGDGRVITVARQPERWRD